MIDALGQRFNLEDQLRVWLDDDLVDRRCPSGWVHLRTAREVCLLLLTGKVKELSLDNDLHGDQEFGQGFQVIDFFEEQHAAGNPLWPEDGIQLHTANPAGRQRMERCFDALERNLNITVDKKFSSTTKPVFFLSGWTKNE